MGKANRLRGSANRRLTDVDESVLNADEAVFGEIRETEGRRIVARPIAIAEIYPDLAQPRRAIPSAMRKTWDGQPTTIHTLFNTWLRAVEDERGAPFDLHAYLTGGMTDRSTQETKSAGQLGQIGSEDGAVGALEYALLQVVELAASIHRDGLTNPITIARKGGFYTIETGERRWLAYHLLNSYFTGIDPEDMTWEKIPARVVDGVSVWRQASENNARDDLNAVAKARQLALLLMDLHGMEHFRPIDNFDDEQGYYAQAVDLAVPHGKSELILNAMGVEHRNVIYRHRNLLKLPYEVWLLADDLNWAERRLRKLTPPTAPKEAITVARQWAGLSPMGDSSKPKQMAAFDYWQTRGFRKLTADLKKMKPHERDHLLDELQRLIAQFRS